MLDDSETFQINPGDTIYIPTAVFHSTHNTSWEPLRLLALYNPGGAERGLKELPDYQEFPPGEVPNLTRS